ncbi:cytosine-specific methyltransferase [Holotrichia oblita]|nr:cytosine-specific methyltransferase [Holotrichia oblita]
MEYKLASLFAGIGGIDLGFENAGFESVWANDIDKFAAVTFKANHKADFVLDSICNIKAKDIPSVSILAGGFPCQAFSIAGYKKGFEDERGSLFFEIARLLREFKEQKRLPQVVFLENVKNLYTHDNGRTFKHIKEELEDIGYHITEKILNTCEYGNTPQNRERIYIIGFLDKKKKDNFKWPQPIKLTNTIDKVVDWNKKQDKNFYYTRNMKCYPLLSENIKNKNSIYQFRRIYIRENKSGVCPTLTANMGEGGHNVPLIVDKDGDIRKLTPSECLQLQGFPKNFIIPKELANSKIYKQAVGSLSGLFSDNDIAMLHYRVPENLYCLDFGAENLSRADVSVDAKLKTKGIGIKTFTENAELQKVAEFNSQQGLYRNLPPLEMVKKIAELRNNRMQFTLNAYGLKDLIYHCVVRNRKGFFLFEEKMNFIDIHNIRLKEVKQHICFFTDGIEEYKFDISKSTLYKRFVTKEYFADVAVDILTNPIEALRQIKLSKEEPIVFYETAIIPLYSYKAGAKFVFEKSGLNEWNASPEKRPRKTDEIYIPLNEPLRSMYDTFFPTRETPFEVELPNGETISMKVCQSDGKALKSNPVTKLGEWLLRDVLKLPHGRVITYEMLLEIGIDAVSFQKLPNGKYKLDFKQVGEFEKFMNKEIMADYE